MADLSLQAKLSPEMPLLEANARLFSLLWQQACDKAPATAAGDADALHDMRVALRRLRSALQNFEGNADAPLLTKRISREYRTWRRELGSLGDALGAVRDGDVLDDYLQKYAKSHLEIALENSAGLAQFEKYIRDARTSCFKPMAKQLSKADGPQKVRESFARWALGLPGIQSPQLVLEEAAKLILVARLDDVAALSHALEIEEDHEDQHEFRKSLRRLRYALETLGVCFQTDLQKPLKKLVLAQDALGEMQDRTVLHATAVACFGKQIPEDVATFLAFGETRRVELLNRTRAWWQKEESGTLQQLRELVSTSQNAE